MDVHQKLDELVATVEGARGMPMSASCVVNRADLLAGLDSVRQALPGSLAEAQEVLGDRAQVVAEAQREAQRIVETAHAERSSLVEDTEVVQQAQAEAARILALARQEAAEVRAEADDYVDSKLANFEVVLGKTIGSVARGRDKLLGPDRAASPEQLLEQADGYVEAQFSAIETALRKTLEAVGRGRQKLSGHRPTDELAEHVAAQEAQGAGQPSDPYAGPYAPGQEEQDTYGYLGMTSPGTAPPPAPSAPPVAAPPAELPTYEPQLQETYAYTPADPDGAYAQPSPYAQQVYDPAASYLAAPQDPYGQQSTQGYEHQPYPPYQQYEPYQPAHPEPHPQPQTGPHPSGVLDETSFFDTGLIDAEQLRRYEQGR